MLFLAGASYEDYEKVKLTWRHPPNAAVSGRKYRVVVEFSKKKRRF